MRLRLIREDNMREPIIIVDYDPAWPQVYEVERARILRVASGLVVDIEHIGSTAVVGLGAKPVIDIMATVQTLAIGRTLIAPLTQQLAYSYVPEYEATFPNRLYLQKHPSTGDQFHLHIVEVNSEFWEVHLLFRDYLRAHPEVAREYDRLKRELAARYGRNRDGYTDAKTDFVESILKKAQASKNHVL